MAADPAAGAASDTAGWAAPAAIHASAGQQPSKSAPGPEVDGAILANWVEAQKFSTTRLRPGYDREEVDAFLEAIRGTSLGVPEPSLTPDEIRDKKFSATRLRPGYDQEEVDAFLDEVEVRLAELTGSVPVKPVRQPSEPRLYADPGGQAVAGAPIAPEPSLAAGPAAEPVQVRCPECGAESAEATQVCARCGAPIAEQRSVAAGPAGGPGDPILPLTGDVPRQPTGQSD